MSVRDPEPTSAVLISPPQSCRLDSHRGTRLRGFVRKKVSSSIAEALVLPQRGCGRSESRPEQHVVESAVLPSEIEALPDLMGYLKFASHPAWMRVSLGRSMTVR